LPQPYYYYQQQQQYQQQLQQYQQQLQQRVTASPLLEQISTQPQNELTLDEILTRFAQESSPLP